MLIAYEDKRFWQHFGVDPLAVMRAAISLAKSGKIKSGASTLTMQTVKLMHPELRKRSFKNKLSQMAEAIRLEAHWSKEEILEATQDYMARNAPRAAVAIAGGLIDPTELGIRDKLAAAKELLDRTGLVKTEKMQVEATGGVMLMPPKEKGNE